ncbi:MAG: hypothetical protein V4508_06415 [Pseudomonadota bacterium]
MARAPFALVLLLAMQALHAACPPVLSEQASWSGARLAQGGYLAWLAPVALAARGNHVFVADAGRRQIYRYDLAQQTMVAFQPLAGSGPFALAVGPDLSLYVADSGLPEIRQWSFDGRLLRVYSDRLQLARPSGLALGEAGELLVADNLYHLLLRFSALGSLVDVLPADQARSLDALARTPQGVFLLDRMGRQLLRLDGAGEMELLAAVPALASAMAAGAGRVFVADGLSIRVLDGDQLRAAGPDGAAFGRISALALEHNTLYVADSMRARVQLLRVAPPCMQEEPHVP